VATMWWCGWRAVRAQHVHTNVCGVHSCYGHSGWSGPVRVPVTCSWLALYGDRVQQGSIQTLRGHWLRHSAADAWEATQSVYCCCRRPCHHDQNMMIWSCRRAWSAFAIAAALGHWFIWSPESCFWVWMLLHGVVRCVLPDGTQCSQWLMLSGDACKQLPPATVAQYHDVDAMAT
jgi:hypothetical protein